MAEIGIYEARAALSRLVERALAGEEIIITRRGRPVVRLTPLEGARAPRKPGALKGMFEVTDAFFEPLPEDVIDAFYEGPIEPEEPGSGEDEEADRKREP